MPQPRGADLSKARAAAQQSYAHRAVSDPVKLQRAANIVRAALARQALTLDDLTPLPEPQKRASA